MRSARDRWGPVDGDAAGLVGSVYEPLAGVGAPRGDGLAAGGSPVDGGLHECAADAAAAEGLGDLGVDEDDTVAINLVDELGVDAVLSVQEAAVAGVVDDLGRSYYGSFLGARRPTCMTHHLFPVVDRSVSGPVTPAGEPPLLARDVPSECDVEVFEPRHADVGGFGARRVLPRSMRMVGAWCFVVRPRREAVDVVDLRRPQSPRDHRPRAVE